MTIYKLLIARALHSLIPSLSKMNLLLLIISLFFNNFVLCDVVVTVTHPVPVTLTYDPVLGSVLPHVPTIASDINSENATEPELVSQQEQEDSLDMEGRVNAKATASIRFKTTMFSTGKTSATGATTDSSSAFKMSLPFAFGTVAAIVMAAIVF